MDKERYYTPHKNGFDQRGNPIAAGERVRITPANEAWFKLCASRLDGKIEVVAVTPKQKQTAAAPAAPAANTQGRK